ncbi:hypothetical protein HanRHA438_Chr17g0841641 [Helianthus annuus]|nr:hypothetical protein HanRHA438_Chr17g0841641 [Helianthus annuus]
MNPFIYIYVCMYSCVCVRREKLRPVNIGWWESKRTSRRSGGRCGGPAPDQAGPKPAPIPSGRYH